MEIKEVFEPIVSFVKNFQKKEKDISKQAAKDRLKLVLMQDRASVSPDFFEMMKKEIIDVIKKYIEIDEESLEVQLTRGYEAGLEGPALYANIPIKNIKPVATNGEDDIVVENEFKEITDLVEDEILDEVSQKTEGSFTVKAEIESITDEVDTVVEDTIISEDINVDEVAEEDEPKTVDSIAENVAKEMKKSANKLPNNKISTAKKGVKRANTAKKNAKKEEAVD